jgi:uncharacterized membrane protein
VYPQVLVSLAVLTVVLSWTVVNIVLTLRYADQSVGSGDAGIAFGDGDRPEKPTYRAFAYIAFTIGMCNQVSDTTGAGSPDPANRALPSSAVLRFGMAIVGGSVNLICA